MSNIKLPPMNNVTISGRITREPDLKYTQSGTPFLKLSIANTRYFKDSGGQRNDETLFVDVTAWAKTAEMAHSSCCKGSPVIIVGRLAQNEWTDKTTGQKRQKIEIVADQIMCLEWPDRDENVNQRAPERDAEPEPIPDDDIPF